MKQTYGSINVATGPYRAGVCLVSVLPKEWLLSNPIISFVTNEITDPLSILPGKEFIVLKLVPDGYKFEEKPKQSKAGEYFDTSIQGLTNGITEVQLQTLETLRHHEFVVIVKSLTKKKKFIGSRESGMRFSFSNTESNKNGGNQEVQIELQMQCDQPSPFYKV